MEVIDGTSHLCLELRLLQIQRKTGYHRQLKIKLARTTVPEIDRKLTTFMERFVNDIWRVPCDEFKLREGKENR